MSAFSLSFFFLFHQYSTASLFSFVYRFLFLLLSFLSFTRAALGARHTRFIGFSLPSFSFFNLLFFYLRNISVEFLLFRLLSSRAIRGGLSIESCADLWLDRVIIGNWRNLGWLRGHIRFDDWFKWFRFLLFGNRLGL